MTISNNRAKLQEHRESLHPLKVGLTKYGWAGRRCSPKLAWEVA